ncbi:MAG: transposase, partial [bacterium]
MVELADIFLRHGPEYLERFSDRMLPSHIRAMEDIINCRTQRMGGQLYQCENPSCREYVYSYHSCSNRSCPKCGQDRTEQWLKKQQKLLIPSHYFLVTFTFPAEFHPISRCNQKLIYDLLFKTSAAALQKLAKDPRFIGGKIGMMGGLHTWTRDMRYHPHVHYIVPGGALCSDNTQWLHSTEDFLVPVEALSSIFRAKFRDSLKKTVLFGQVPRHVWQKDWVVHCKPVQDGTKALKYLAPYIYRVAITNNRILSAENGVVVFRYKDSETAQWNLASVPAMEF